jgi:elongation factor G
MALSSNTSRIRNLGIAAHIDAGKTTVTERMLYYSGLIHRMGTVDDGNTTTDFLPEERERGITIQSAAVTIPWHDYHINIIDTPGHVDFTAEVERSLRVLDGAVIVFCGSGGVEAQSETVWRQADHYAVARIAFVNKLDRIGADFDRVVDEIRARLGAHPLAVTFPNGSQESLRGIVDVIQMEELRFDTTGKTADVQRLPLEGELLAEAEARRSNLIEEAAELDDELATAFLEGREIANDELKAAIRRLTIAGAAQPVFCGAALRNVGVQPLIDGVIDFLPSPRDIRETHGFDPTSGEKIARKNYPDQPFSGLIFKTVSDSHGELSFMRVYSGSVKEGERLLNARRNRKEKIGRLYMMFADERRPVQEASAGDIVALLGLKFSTTGDTLSHPDKPISYERLTFPEPVVSMAIEPKTNADREKLLTALERISKDDPTFFARFDEETGQQIIAGMGELHLEVRTHELEHQHGVKINVGEPRVSYREGLRGKGKASALVDTPLGGQNQFAEVNVGVESYPNEEQGRVVFANLLPEDQPLPGEILEAVEQSARDAASGGVLRGDPMIDIRVSLLGASFREGESTPAAFARATAIAFGEAARNADPLLLEPIMSFEVVSPEEFLGGVLRDLQMRGAEVGEVAIRDDRRVVSGRVPLSRMFQYAGILRSLSQGRAACSLEPSEYGEVSKQDYLRLVGE